MAGFHHRGDHSTRTRYAFTLIELMVAIALSIGIILVAYVAFRTFSQAFNRATQMMHQNDLARRGIIMAYEQLDTWADYADPGYPYGKVANSLNNVRIDGTVASTVTSDDNAANKALFRSIEFAASGNFNPNWMQPHDPRAWYRNHLMPSPRPPVRNGGNGWFYWPNAKYGGTGSAGGWNKATSDIPIGWEGRHVFGDYALVANLAMDPGDPDPEIATAAARPNFILTCFVELGAHGLLAYLPPAAIPMIQMPSDGLPVKAANPGDWRANAALGEVPWAQAFNDSMTNAGGKFWRGRERVLLPGLDWAAFSSNGLTYPTGAANHPYAVTASGPGIRLDQFHRANLADFLYAAGFQGLYAFDMGQITSDNLVFHPNFIGRDFSGAWDTTMWRRGVRAPLWRSTWSIGRLNENMPAINGTGLLDFGNALYLNPQWPANAPTAPDPAVRLPDTPIATLSSVRYRFRGGEFCNGVLRLADPASGDVVIFGIYGIGTTLRGARQHWALQSDDPATSAFDPTMGDRYQ